MFRSNMFGTTKRSVNKYNFFGTWRWCLKYMKTWDRLWCVYFPRYCMGVCLLVCQTNKKKVHTWKQYHRQVSWYLHVILHHVFYYCMFLSFLFRDMWSLVEEKEKYEKKNINKKDVMLFVLHKKGKIVYDWHIIKWNRENKRVVRMCQIFSRFFFVHEKL